MKYIKLISGEKVKVSNRDYDKVIPYKWYRIKMGNNLYARRIWMENGKRKAQYMHNFLLGIKGIDHKDGNGLNNKRNNLRPCTQSDNLKNRKGFGSSKFIGVSAHQGRWLSKITLNKKQKYLGWFKTEEEAAKRYNEEAIKSGNNFFRLNQI